MPLFLVERDKQRHTTPLFSSGIVRHRFPNAIPCKDLEWWKISNSVKLCLLSCSSPSARILSRFTMNKNRVFLLYYFRNLTECNSFCTYPGQVQSLFTRRVAEVCTDINRSTKTTLISINCYLTFTLLWSGTRVLLIL